MKTYVSKWIVQALLPAHSNLQTLLRYYIAQLQPSYHGFWGPSSLWLFLLISLLKVVQKFDITLLGYGK